MEEMVVGYMVSGGDGGAGVKLPREVMLPLFTG